MSLKCACNNANLRNKPNKDIQEYKKGFWSTIAKVINHPSRYFFLYVIYI